MSQNPIMKKPGDINFDTKDNKKCLTTFLQECSGTGIALIVGNNGIMVRRDGTGSVFRYSNGKVEQIN